MLTNRNCQIEDLEEETWGSDFDDDLEEDEQSHPKIPGNGELYEIPDGKPAYVGVNSIKNGLGTSIPHWFKKTESDMNSSLISKQSLSNTTDENLKPNGSGTGSGTRSPGTAVYIENVLLPTRATKDDESKNFIEALKRKLSQKNLLSGSGTNAGSAHKNSTNAGTKYTEKKPTIQRLNSIEAEGIQKLMESVQKFPWFYRVDRNKAELILENYESDGSFLVRECHHGGPNVALTLTLRFARRLFHIQIRSRTDGRFALGSSKENEMHFSTIQELIDTYRKTALQLHTNGKFYGETKLTNPPIVYSFSK